MLKIPITQVKSQQTPVILSSCFYQLIVFAYMFIEKSSSSAYFFVVVVKIMFYKISKNIKVFHR